MVVGVVGDKHRVRSHTHTLPRLLPQSMVTYDIGEVFVLLRHGCARSVAGCSSSSSSIEREKVCVENKDKCENKPERATVTFGKMLNHLLHFGLSVCSSVHPSVA